MITKNNHNAGSLPILKEWKCHKVHDWNNWWSKNIDIRLDKSIVTMLTLLNFLKCTMAKRMSFYFCP